MFNYMAHTAEAPQEGQEQASKKHTLIDRAIKLALEVGIPILIFKGIEYLAPTVVRLSHPESKPENNQALMQELGKVKTEFAAYTQQPEEVRREKAGQMAAGLKASAVARLAEIGLDDPADADLIAQAVKHDSHRQHLEATGLTVLVRSRLNDVDVLNNDVNTPEHAAQLHTRSGHAVEFGNAALEFLGVHGSRRLNHQAISDEVFRRQLEDTVQLTARAMQIDAKPISTGDERTIGEILTQAEDTMIDHAHRGKERKRVRNVIKGLTAEQKAGLYGVALSLAAVNALTDENQLSREAEGLVYLSERIATNKAAREASQPQA